IQLEYLFEKFGRRLLLRRAFLAQTQMQKQIFDARNRIAQRAVRVVQLRRPLKRQFALVFAGPDEIVGMELPAQLVKLRLKRIGVESQLLRKLEKREIVGARRRRLHFAACGAKMPAIHGLLATPALRCSGGIRSRLRHTHALSNEIRGLSATVISKPGQAACATEPQAV